MHQKLQKKKFNKIKIKLKITFKLFRNKIFKFNKKI